MLTHQELQQTRKKLQMVEKKVHQTHDELEKLTAENKLLQQKIIEYKQAEESWQKKEKIYCEQKEAAVQESNVKFKQFAENIEAVIWWEDPQTGQFLYVNPAYEKIWGRDRQSLYEKPRSWMDAVHPDDRDRVNQMMAKYLAGESIDIEYRILRPDGLVRWICYRTFAMRDQQGNICYLAGMSEDITERKHTQESWRDSAEQPQSILIVDTDITQKKQLEEQFFRTQRLESLGTLAGGIAHDLNNILTPILAASQLLQLRFPQDKERYYQLMTIIESNAKRGAALVKQVLSFARGFQGDRTIILIKHLISETLLIAKQTFPKSIEFEISIPNNLCAISGDITQLHQVLMNLVVNARDAMPEGGKISISAENIFIDEAYAKMNLDAQVGHHILITVADTGVGMPPEILDKIFEPFFTTKEVGSGTGLGLSTVLGIIKSHGGFVSVSSKVGRGSKFKLFLPAVEGSLTLNPEKLAVPLGQGELILVVDDEAQIREIATIVLENYNYKVLTANNGIEAIALYAQHKHQIKVVLMDMMMPEMDGITAIRTLQKMNSQVQIIACSGLDTHEDLTEAVNANVQLVLPKPFTAQDLLNSLQHILRG